jgi:hypothetical protein
MALKRQLAALVWAAAVIVAAQFLASVAQAHAGHDHASHSAVVVSVDRVADTDKSAEAEQITAPVELVSVDSNPIPAVPSSGCNGSCCGTGTTCCGAVVLFASAASLPDVGVGRQPLGLASAALPGIHPGALRKPPKSFA